MISVRATVPGDFPAIQRIELAAGELFRDIGMIDIAEHPAPSTEMLARYEYAGRSWVVMGDPGGVIAFVLVKLVDGYAHLEQVSVDPQHGRRRLGRALIDQVESFVQVRFGEPVDLSGLTWAADLRLPALTLTTFRDVPWNGPYYERLAFAVMSPSERGPELVALMADEAERGFAPAQRIAMLRSIGIGR